jgi:SAM-dependent methyltransferase
MVIGLINRLLPTRSHTAITQWEHATHWWRALLRPDGLLPFSPLTAKSASLEASAAMVPGLIRWGFGAEAQHLTDGLLKLQQATGDWQQNTWVTGQCLTALMADMRQCLIQGRSFRSAVERGFLQGCDWVYDQIQPDGRLLNVNIQTWGADTVPDAVALTSLVPLAWAAKVANRPQYRLAVERALRFYLLDTLPGFCMASPYYAQLLWALTQLGQQATADKLLLALPLTTKGEIPATANSHVVHIPALLLWSQVYYALGHSAMGKHLFERAQTYQNPRTGAFPVLSQRSRDWPVIGQAWYLSGLDMFLTKNREAAAMLLPDTLNQDDPRITWLSEQLAGHPQLLEVQSGKGRFSKALKHNHVGQQWFVTEPCPDILQGLNFPIHGREGVWQQLPYASDSFDAVFGIDSLSQSIYLVGALRETARVLKSGGHLAVIEQADPPSHPWRINLTAAQWQAALMQAGFTVLKTGTLADGSLALLSKRA